MNVGEVGLGIPLLIVGEDSGGEVEPEVVDQEVEPLTRGIGVEREDVLLPHLIHVIVPEGEPNPPGRAGILGVSQSDQDQ